ncbi:hypothetical protein IAU60_002298 [Kwoniella sp. DSM 27419]
MKFTLPLAITFSLLSAVASASLAPGSGSAQGIAVVGRNIAPAHHGFGHIRRQTTTAGGDGSTTSGDGSTGDASDSGDGSTSPDGGDGTTDDGTTASATDDGSAGATATPTYTYDGSGGQEGDGGPSLTLSGDTGSTPPANDLTSAAPTSLGTSEFTSVAPSTSHSGLTDYNTTTRTPSASVRGTSQAQTSTTSGAAATSSAPASSAKPVLSSVSPLGLMTLVIAGGLGALKVFA